MLSLFRSGHGVERVPHGSALSLVAAVWGMRQNCPTSEAAVRRYREFCNYARWFSGRILFEDQGRNIPAIGKASRSFHASEDGSTRGRVTLRDGHIAVGDVVRRRTASQQMLFALGVWGVG